MSLTHNVNGSVTFGNSKAGTAVALIGPDGEVLGASGAALTPAHTVATASGSSSLMIAANTSRKYLLIQNDGAVDVYIKIAATAVINSGIRLLANGGSYEMGAAFGNLVTGLINGITVSGSAVVMMTEEV